MFWLIMVMEVIEKYTYNLEEGKKNSFESYVLRRKSLIKIIYNMPKGDNLWI